MELEAERRRLEQELEEAEEAGDPLSSWGNHLGWFEGKKLTGQQAYRDALQRCIEYFASMPHFNTDIRLAKIYIKSAGVSKDAIAVYKHMLSESIGTYHAIVYDSMANALIDQGKTLEAVKVLETGIKKKAQPIRVLQRKLDSLQGQENQVSRPIAGSNSGMTTAVMKKTPHSRSGQIVCYPKDLVYPVEGGEVSLEEIRGRMEQYKPIFSEEGECDMEMTMAYTGHITMHVPLVPDLSKQGKALIRSGVPSHSGVNPSHASNDIGELDELEQLCAEKSPPFIKPVTPDLKKNLSQEYTEEDFEKQLEQLVLEKNQPENVRDKENQPLVTSLSYARDKENQPLVTSLSYARDKENQPLVTSLSYARDKENQPLVTSLSYARDKENQPLVTSLSYARDKENQPLVTSLSYARDKENQPLVTSLSYARDKENQPSLSYVRDKENRDVVDVKKSRFDFTPTTVDGGVHWPGGVNCNNSGFPNTKLNFSDVSVSSQSHASLLGRDDAKVLSQYNLSNASGGRLGVINTSLDIEKRAKLTEEQLKFEREFASTEVEVMEEPSLSNSQSFDVYHDSWMSQSRNTSQNIHQKNSSSFATSQHNNSSVQSFEVYHDSWMSQPDNTNHSLHQPCTNVVLAKQNDTKSHLNVNHTTTAPGGERRALQQLRIPEPAVCQSEDSFSVYEDESQDQSSFVPFHDSWANNPSKKSTDEGEKVQGLMYRVPLGVPINTSSNDEDHQKSYHHMIDQSFTQFDIPHPHIVDPSSTPRHIAPMMSTFLDMSAIPSADDYKHKQPLPLVDHHHHGVTESHHCQKVELSAIPEESGSYKSSSSSSRMTSSSSNSTHSSTVSPYDSVMENVNPFEAHIVNMMLNTLGVPLGKIEMISGTFPKIVKGCDVIIGGDAYTDVHQLVEGGFATVYLSKCNGEHKILKVEVPSCEWEVAVLDEIHMRLNGLQDKCCSIINYERALRYKDTSVLVLPYFPHGSVLDLVNTCKNQRSFLSEPMLLYYSAEMCTVVDTLHEIGIIHADLKPDNFMIRDIRSHPSFQSAKGRGVCLIDFGRAIDTKRFHEDQLFVGSCNTEGFQCVAMIEGKPWKWQVDYFGLAATIFSLMHGDYLKVKKSASDGMYRPTVKVKRRYDIGLWNKVFEILLNASSYLPLSQFVQPLEEQLYTKMICDFKMEVTSCLESLARYLNTRKH